MTPEEKSLIEGVFNRLSQSGVGTKDVQADTFIRDRAQSTPDSLYGLVQAVIMLEVGLNHAQAQIAELKAQGVPANSAGSFLPQSGPWATAQAQRAAYPPPPMPAYPAAGPSAGPWAQPAAPSPVGGFLRNAATMAAGVAGGTLIAEGLSSMFGGHNYGGFGGGGFGGGGFGGGGFGPGNVENVTVNNYYDNDAGGRQDAGSQDAADDGASADNDDYSGGFDGGSSGDDGSI